MSELNLMKRRTILARILRMMVEKPAMMATRPRRRRMLALMNQRRDGKLLRSFVSRKARN
jgi:hypothetical protein